MNRVFCASDAFWRTQVLCLFLQKGQAMQCGASLEGWGLNPDHVTSKPLSSPGPAPVLRAITGEPVRGKAFIPLLFTTDLCSASLSTVRPFHRTNQTDVSERSGAPHCSLPSVFHARSSPFSAALTAYCSYGCSFSP